MIVIIKIFGWLIGCPMARPLYISISDFKIQFCQINDDGSNGHKTKKGLKHTRTPKYDKEHPLARFF